MTKPFALIIEDNDKIAEIFSMALQAAEFETEIVSDGEAALTRLTQIEPSVVVLDLHLPHISGVEILHEIRADKRLAKTKVMVTTADAITAENLRDEADLVLLKPVSIVQLRDLAKRMSLSSTIK